MKRAGRTSTRAGEVVAAAAMAQPLQRQGRGGRAQPPGIAVDDGDGGMGELRQRRIVPADQGKIAAHRQAAAIDRPQAADEQRQAAGEQSRGRGGAVENAQDLGLRGIGVMLGRDRQGAILQPLGAKLILQPRQPLPSGAAHQGARQGRDLAMAEADEMADGGPHPAAMIGANRIDRQGHAQLALQRHDRPVEFGKGGQKPGIVFARGRDQNRIDAPAVEMADICRVRRRVVIGAHDQQRIAGGPQDEFRPRHDLRREGIGEIGSDETDEVGRSAPEALGN